MQVFFLTLFLSISIVQTLDYNINNQQICTQKPFTVNFNHQCSRTRLSDNINTPNTNQILYITIILNITSNKNTTFTINKSSKYNQKIYLIFLTNNRQYMYMNNKTMLILDNITINSYLYDTSNEEYTQIFKPMSAVDWFSPSKFYCILKNEKLLPPQNITRIYYLYTNETNLKLDFSRSTSQISPLFKQFEICYTTKTRLITSAIIIIVFACLLSLTALILIIICLKRQVRALFVILDNCLNQRVTRLPPITIIDPQPMS